MMMSRKLTVAAGLCGLVGAALLMDAVAPLWADPVYETGTYPGECPYTSNEHSDVVACAPTITTVTCGDFTNRPEICDLKVGALTLNQFPTECIGTEYASACDQRIRNCYQETKCWFSNSLNKCLLSDAPEDWHTDWKRVNLRCLTGPIE
jgi:hypothetical protein